MGVAAGLADSVDAGADGLAALGEEHDFVFVVDAEGADDGGFGFGFHGDDAFAAAGLDAVNGALVVVVGGAFAEAVAGGDEHGAGGVHDFHGANGVAGGEFHAADAGGGAADEADAFGGFGGVSGVGLGGGVVGGGVGGVVIDGEADGDAVVGDHDDFAGVGGEFDGDEFVAVLDVDGDDAAAVAVGVFAEECFFDESVFGAEDEAFVLGVVFDAEHGGEFFAVLEFEDVGEGAAFGGAGAFGDFVNFFDVNASVVHEEHDGVVGGGGEEVFDEVFVVGVDADEAFAAAFLGAVCGDGGAFDEAVVGDGDDAAFVGDDVFHAHFAFGGLDACEAWGFVFFGGVAELGFDDGEEFVFVGEDGFELFDGGEDFGVFGFDFFAFEACELVEAEVEDGVGLAFAEGVFGDEFFTGFVAVGAGADDFDEVVEVAQCDAEAFEDVGAVFGFLEAVAGAAGDDVAAVLDEAFEHFAHVHLLGAAFVEGEEDDAEGAFEGGVLEEFVDDDAGGFAALEFDDDAGELGGFVAQVGDFVYDFVADEFGDFFDEGGAVDVVGDFGDDDLLLAALEFLGVGDAAQFDDAAPGADVLGDGVASVDDAASGEVGALDDALDFVEGEVGVVNEAAGGFGEFGKVVGGDVGSHADGNAGGAVHEEEGEAAGEDGRLGGGLVVVGGKIHSVLVNVGEEFRGDFGEFALGVAIGRGVVALDGAEIALGEDERVTHNPVLGEADEGVINGCVAVGVVVFKDFADDAGALGEGAVVEEAFTEHGVEDAALDGLEAVAGIGECACNDD